ncbi:MAG: STAS domain-containing protein [Methylococcaceae bacterium]|nr:STAS domain-containing protein [Methylococcaceae bacterium]MCI0734199.1 STAS domain-containing protein [Methylococcaceae bacterium]
MKITKQKGTSKSTGLCRLQIEGDMTIYQAAEMMEKFVPCWNDYREFELNLSGVGEMDSAGVQLLLMFDRKSEGYDKKVRLLEIREAVSEVLNLYRLGQRFDIQTSPRQ